jgi:hypothetical protein
MRCGILIRSGLNRGHMVHRHEAWFAKTIPQKGTAVPRLGSIRTFVGWMGGLMILLATPPGWGHDASIIPVGHITAMQGRIMVVHSGETKPLRANIPDDVVPHDVIHTAAKARSKILFQDDTFLTIGENSMVKIDEHIYDSSVDTRSVALTLKKGKVRALVGRIFGGKGSKFIVRTPTGFAASQGTYFVVWTDGAMSGVANIGTTGQVFFTSGGRTVALNAQHFSVASDHVAPTAPGLLVWAPADVSQAVASTEFKEAFVTESAKDVLRSFDQRRESSVPVQRIAPATIFQRRLHSVMSAEF